jgi:uncharacterized tellurite resistance protein B-like protein
MKLPQEIAATFARQTGPAAPLLALRALADLEGNLGETHVVAAADALRLYSRRLGQAVRDVCLPWAELTAIHLEDDRPFVFLCLGTATTTHRLKFGNLDKGELERLQQLWQAGAAQPATPAVPATPTGAPAALTPFLGFAAALYALMEVDGAADAEERHQLTRLLGSAELLTQAHDYLRRHSLADLQRELPPLLGTAQRQCLMANLLEFAMIDGYLRGSEQELLQQWRQHLAISDDDYNAIYAVLHLKNNLADFVS